MFREEREMSTKKRMEKARKDPVKSQAPQKPISGSSKVSYATQMMAIIGMA